MLTQQQLYAFFEISGIHIVYDFSGVYLVIHIYFEWQLPM